MPDAVMPERWLPVVGYEGLYEVSDWGRVRSVDRLVPVAGPHKRRRYRGRIIQSSACSNASRHHFVHLNVSGRSVPRTVHSLVAEAFIGPRPPGLVVLHGPGGSADNQVRNLSYGTYSQNGRDMRRDGTDFHLNIEDCPRGHPLKSPNLVPSLVRINRRNCLACSRANARVRDQRKRNGIELDLQVESDRYFAAIMDAAPVESELRTAG